MSQFQKKDHIVKLREMKAELKESVKEHKASLRDLMPKERLEEILKKAKIIHFKESNGRDQEMTNEDLKEALRASEMEFIV